MRIGMGYDVHKLVPDRKLILCGVEIPHHLGLLADALLGAAALGDIGKLFPDTDPAYEGADSMQLLKQVGSLLDDYGYTIGNVDATIIAQNPKLAPYRDLMRQNVARVLAIPVDCVSIKATTEEHLGFTGREEGIAAQAVCLLNEYSDFERSTGGCGGCCPMQQQ